MSAQPDPLYSQQHPDEQPQRTPSQVVDMLDRQWREARIWWEPVRLKARKARDYYHMLQWSAKQQRTLREQERPAIVINLIGKAVDNVCGRERANRYTPKAAPIGQPEVLAAGAMTHGLSGVWRLTEAKYRVSEAFEHAVIGPMGWGEVGYDDSNPEQDPELVDAPDPEEMYFDPHSRRLDLYDAKYVIRRRIVDVEDAIGIAPHLEEQLRAAAMDKIEDDDGMGETERIEGDYDNMEQPDDHRGNVTVSFPLERGDEDRRGRPRLALREHQWWEREDAQWLELEDGERFYLDDLDDFTAYRLRMSGAELVEGKRRCYYQAIVCGRLLLWHGKMNPTFGRFSYVALFAKRDRHGRPYGLVERAIPCQEEVNVARSKLNAAIRSRWLIYRKGSLGNTPESEIKKRLGRGNFVLGVEDPSACQMGSDRADVQAWLEMIQMAKQEIDDVFGNNEAAYGDKSQEISGVAQQIRIQQQATNLGGIFDNLRYFRKQIGEMLLVVLQKHTTPKRLQRMITGSVMDQMAQMRLGPNGTPAPVPQPDFSWLTQMMAGPIYQNRYMVDIEDQAETGTQRQAEMQQRTELLGMVSEPMRDMMLPDTLRATDWSGAEDMASKVEQANKAQQMAAQAANAQPPKQLLNYKDAPPDIQRQMEAKDGYQPSQMPVQVQPPDPNKLAELSSRERMQAADHAHEYRMAALGHESKAVLQQAGHLQGLEAQAQQPTAPPDQGGASS